MSKFKPKFEKGDKVRNLHTGDRYVVIDMNYSKKYCDIEYKMQNYRRKFDMFKLPECVIIRNIEEDNYEVITS